MGIVDKQRLRVELYALHSSRDGLLHEIEQLGELWLEWRAKGKDTTQIDRAIRQATTELRNKNNKIHTLEKRLGG